MRAKIFIRYFFLVGIYFGILTAVQENSISLRSVAKEDGAKVNAVLPSEVLAEHFFEYRRWDSIAKSSVLVCESLAFVREGGKLVEYTCPSLKRVEFDSIQTPNTFYRFMTAMSRRRDKILEVLREEFEVGQHFSSPEMQVIMPSDEALSERFYERRVEKFFPFSEKLKFGGREVFIISVVRDIEKMFQEEFKDLVKHFSEKESDPRNIASFALSTMDKRRLAVYTILFEKENPQALGIFKKMGIL